MFLPVREKEYEVGWVGNSPPVSPSRITYSLPSPAPSSVFPSPHPQTSGSCSLAPSPYTHPSQAGRWILSVTERKLITLLSLCPHTWPIYKPDSLCSESSQMLCVSASGTFSRTGSNCNEFYHLENHSRPGLSLRFYTLRRN